MTFSLVVLNGRHTGTTISLDEGTPVITLGRHSSNDIQLDDDRASRMHSRVLWRNGRWHLEDCDSLNGTLLNSQPLQHSVMESGDLIRIGDRLILFVDDSAGGGTEIQTSLFRATTSLGQNSNTDVSGTLVEQSASESMARVVRDSGVLSRLANLLHQYSDSDELIRSTVASLVDGIAADQVSVWLVGADGRLRCVEHSGEVPDEHLLASLAVEKRKAMLIELPSESRDVADKQPIAGRSLAVPMAGPQACRGAIQCHRKADREPFAEADLDFAVIVAHQTGLALENLEHRERLELANAELRRRVSSQKQLVGSSAAMQKVFDQIALVGPANSNVLVLGESGTGKELVARSLHDLSRHRAGPYLTVNCAAFTESLLESELFGHDVGAFTGADRRHLGQFERAHRGTIFLDEIGEMSLACQAKLLRVLEGHPFQRLGGDDWISVEVRVIAATHRNLPELIEQGRFREDLYYRLRVIDIQVPPLRDRVDDILELAALFIERFRNQLGKGIRRLSPAAADAIKAYQWPGNVRELKNAVERAVVLGSGEEVTTAELGIPESHLTPKDLPMLMTTLKEAEIRHIQQVLASVKGNKTQACKILGIGRATLYGKLGSPNGA
ncbi:MAG: sigma 54-interacting transcriptional regulator [Pirellulaceae bacterium]|nr:sigma 54-interacting transcriptional regulator [Pirellulaceae bacterium]HJN08387.1 sigma 54-interacting transcriptional regulator [Pirellulaceae bacterium]